MKTKHACVCLRRLDKQREENVQEGVKAAHEKERTALCVASSPADSGLLAAASQALVGFALLTKRSVCWQRLVVQWSRAPEDNGMKRRKEQDLPEADSCFPR